TRGRRHQDALERLQATAVVTEVADVHRIALTSLNRGCNVHPPHRGEDLLFDILNREAVAGDLIASEREVEVIAARHTLRVDVAGPWHVLQHLFEVLADLLDGFKFGSFDLDADRRANAGGEHVSPRLDGHGPGVGNPGDLERLVHGIDELFGR